MLRWGRAGAHLLAVRLPREVFEAGFGGASDAAPAGLMAMLDNVVVLVEDRNEDEPDLLGLYEGHALTERGWQYGGALPAPVLIYRAALLAPRATPDQGDEEGTVTVVHEIAHHFGIGEQRLHELGWG